MRRLFFKIYQPNGSAPGMHHWQLTPDTTKTRPAAWAVGRFVFLMWYLRGSNQGHADFQSTALPLS